MRITTLQIRTLTRRWRTNAATVLAVAVAAAILTGALVVGESMRGSLRAHALARLGPVDWAMTAPRFVTQSLADRINSDSRFSSQFGKICSAILIRGGAENAGTRARANRINIMGIDQRFPMLWDRTDVLPSGQSVVLNEPLARRLGVHPGEDILIRMPRHDRIPPETLLGRRDSAYSGLRLTVSKVIASEGLGGFALDASGAVPRNAYVDMKTLQRALDRPDHINTILVAGGTIGRGNDADAPAILQRLLDEHAILADYGLSLDNGSLKSENLFIPPAVEKAALSLQPSAVRTLTYLANTIAAEPLEPKRPEIPYSVVAAVDRLTTRGETPLAAEGSTLGEALGPDEILLSEWAADDLRVQPGDSVRLTYYTAEDLGELGAAGAVFRVRGILPMQQIESLRGLVPPYKGMTDSRRISDWDPPFPIDLKRVRPRDENYWDQYGPTPKALVSLEAGQRLWTQTTGRFGRITSIEFGPVPAGGNSPDRAESLRRSLPPEALGLSFQPVRAEALAAAEGNTDFGMLFIAFSFFLMAAAAMLIALVFRLNLEKRLPEVGILLAGGFGPGKVGRMLLMEGLLLAVLGSAVGLIGSVGYAWLMLRMLGWLWPGETGAGSLDLHLDALTLAGGFVAGVVLALSAIGWSLRGLTRRPVRALLAGWVESQSFIAKPMRNRVALGTAIGAVGLSAVLAFTAHAGRLSEAAGFFGSGAAMLMAFIAAVRFWLARPPHSGPGDASVSLLGLGIRNARRNPQRSLLSVGLVAASTFLVVAVGANRQRHDRSQRDKHSGIGGFALVAESTIPILKNLGGPEAQAELPLSPETRQQLVDAKVFGFRLRPGDDASCLSLRQARAPRIVGAGPDMIRRGGFFFASTYPSEEPGVQENPWRLLNHEFEDGAVPAIGDESTVKWMLHLGLGRDLIIRDEHAKEARLRFVGLLSGSMLQSEVVIAEDRFTNLFPSRAGRAFFLVEADAATAPALGRALEQDLKDYGLEIEPAVDRLGRFTAVENTYLSAFQLLGGLGIMLGTVGLAAVMLRNLLERRRELALLEAVGFSRTQIGRMLLAENTALLVVGLLAGLVSALVAALPHLRPGIAHGPWAAVIDLAFLVLVVGALSSAAALSLALRGPLVPALRSE